MINYTCPIQKKNVYHLDTEVLIHALCAIHVGFILTYKHNSFNFDYYTCTILNHYQFNNIFDTKEFNFWSYLWGMNSLNFNLKNWIQVIENISQWQQYSYLQQVWSLRNIKWHHCMLSEIMTFFARVHERNKTKTGAPSDTFVCHWRHM